MKQALRDSILSWVPLLGLVLIPQAPPFLAPDVLLITGLGTMIPVSYSLEPWELWAQMTLSCFDFSNICLMTILTCHV